MVNENEVKHIAALARIEFTEKDIQKFQHELSNTLAFVDILREAKTQESGTHTEEGQKAGENLSSAAESDDHRTIPQGTANELVEALPAKEKNFAVVRSVF